MIYNGLFLGKRKIFRCPGEDPVRGELRMRFGVQLAFGWSEADPFPAAPLLLPPPSKRNEVGTDCCKALGAICWKGNPGLPFSSGWVMPGAVNPGSSEWPGRTTSFLWWRRSWQAEMLSLQTTFERHIKMPNKTCWLLNPLSNYSFQIGAAALKRSWGNF